MFSFDGYVYYMLQILEEYGLKHAEKVRQEIEAGKEESKVQGLLEQWLREGKMTEAEALMTSTDMFAAGVDTVSHPKGNTIILTFCMHVYQTMYTIHGWTLNYTSDSFDEKSCIVMIYIVFIIPRQLH